jgi:molybdopterin-guanine dinucleotide biosynthesis protein A
MGRPKATLPFGAEIMLERVVRLLGAVVDTIVVVAAPTQTLPEVDRTVGVVRDERAGRGPLQGLHAGLLALQPLASAAYVTSCDVPFLMPAFVRRLIDLLDDYEIVVPKDSTYYHPLAAVYRTGLLPRIESLLAQDRLRPFYLFESAKTREVPVEQLRDVDPELGTLTNMNAPEDYRDALLRAGLPVPDWLTSP